MEIVKTPVYKLSELSDEAKERARAWLREGVSDFEWYDVVFEDAKTIGKLMGIEIADIHFSGFSSQGDGALFEGTYEYRKGSVNLVKGHVGNTQPSDLEVIRIAQELAKFQRRFFYSITAEIMHKNHEYSHKNCAEIVGYDRYGYLGIGASGIETDKELSEILRDFMEWIYRRLEAEFNWNDEDKQVDETITINEYSFTAEGVRFG